jgi:hypothetical protein
MFGGLLGPGCVVLLVVPNVSKERIALIFRVQHRS